MRIDNNVNPYGVVEIHCVPYDDTAGKKRQIIANILAYTGPGQVEGEAEWFTADIWYAGRNCPVGGLGARNLRTKGARTLGGLKKHLTAWYEELGLKPSQVTEVTAGVTR